MMDHKSGQRLSRPEPTTVLVIGGSDSGKSAVAEDYACLVGKGRPLYYLATMQTGTQAAADKISKHQNQRAGKGFITIEQPLAVWSEELSQLLSDQSARPVVLLEDLGNLVANELFGQSAPAFENRPVWEQWKKDTGRRILDWCAQLCAISDLIIVSNDVFRDGCRYEAGTEDFRQVLAEIHLDLAVRSEVVEVVGGLADIISDRVRRQHD